MIGDVANTDPLWGGILTALSVDTTERAVVADVRVLEDGIWRDYRLRLLGVEELRIERPDGDWEYTEVTEVHATSAAGRTQVEIVFWAEPNGMSGSCRDLAVEHA
jgi:hypothetical protein